MVACFKLQVYKEQIVYLGFQFQYNKQCLGADWKRVIASSDAPVRVPGDGTWPQHKGVLQDLQQSLDRRLCSRQVLCS